MKKILLFVLLFAVPCFAQDNISQSTGIIGNGRLLGAQTYDAQTIVGVLGVDSNGNTVLDSLSGKGVIHRVNGTNEVTFKNDELEFTAAGKVDSPTTLTFDISGTSEAILSASALYPNAVAGNSLGSSTKPWLQVVSGKIALDADVTSATGANVGLVAIQNFGSDSGDMALVGYGANTDGAILQTFKTRATTSDANTIVVSGDTLFQLTAYGADGASYRRAAQILITSSTTPGSGDMPGAIDFQTTPDGSATPASALKLDHNKLATFAGQVTSTATSDLGWAVVAGANTACNSTCTTACVFGVNTAATEADIVGCADATADECLCAGAS